MGEIRKTYTVEFKHKLLQMYVNEEIGGYKTIANQLNIKEPYVISDNPLTREFQTSRLNEKWATDIIMCLYCFQTKEHVIQAVEKYIRFYNQKRFQSKLNNLSPIEYRTQVCA
ncbi:IS3 family transposase [Bacillus songklensis]|uniref:IS3 family transposase n=1 Tax=Bacillus songklensis TaxID=1069116 RepID=A0ABV8B6L9_9BACI